ncbi:DeoR/GlpR family transcriptional regulator of sugar metabolism [Diaminobutyricimonas aerilata]|uniref:Lactose phosphotransferase system repressor n=1 Tax=Diaminobutyricimonas aerilata TaxID=1162967 RepID=A0A2M9CI92_9MICO|nr:DeoR/GlpR family DNA-binding transcription regulator [Diaminobutyricimonas aerilata]PJJ71589.1 DeoR/GlpR family transcriptional regulator of sugar metabolism [Diaminobutyricimonas aerilata]
MDQQTRHDRILDRLEEVEQVTVTELAALLDASEPTVRRDLLDLDKRGRLRRVHGGARRLALRTREAPYSARAVSSGDAKRRMAAAVASRLSPGESLLLDSGTSCLEVAHAIEQQDLRVMPLSLAAANALAEAPRIRLSLPGGDVRPGEGSFVGPAAEESVRRFRFDTAVISGCGFSMIDGVTAYDIGDAAVKMAAVRSAARSILVCDAAKWGTVAFAWAAHVREFAMIVTDHEPTDDERDIAERHDVEFVIV